MLKSVAMRLRYFLESRDHLRYWLKSLLLPRFETTSVFQTRYIANELNPIWDELFNEDVCHQVGLEHFLSSLKIGFSVKSVSWKIKKKHYRYLWGVLNTMEFM